MLDLKGGSIKHIYDISVVRIGVFDRLYQSLSYLPTAREQATSDSIQRQTIFKLLSILFRYVGTHMLVTFFIVSGTGIGTGVVIDVPQLTLEYTLFFVV